MARINYDGEEDILHLSKGSKVKESINVGDFTIDIGHKGFVVGVEILNTSENLHITREQLEALEEGSVNVKYKPNQTLVSLILKLKDSYKNITIPLAIDLGHNKVSAEKIEFGMVS